MKTSLVAAAILLAASATANAATVSALASANSTIKPAGPRSGASNNTFFNVEGDNNAANASYGVIDFTASAFGASSATAVNSLVLTLTESDAAFSTPGSVTVWLASNASASIANDGSSTLTYGAGLTPEGIGSTAAFGTLTNLGDIVFPTTGNTNTGGTESLNLASLSPTVAAALLADLHNNSTVRFVLTPDSASTAATCAGFTNSTQGTPGPTLSLDITPGAAPEPASLGVLALGALGLLSRRRR